MIRTLQSGRRPASQPFWLRFLALASMLLIFFASSAQAAHVHGDWLPHQDAQAASHATTQPAADEASCPLCVAMHSAITARSEFQATVQLPVTSAAVEVLTRASSRDWHFTQFSRPPPSTSL